MKALLIAICLVCNISTLLANNDQHNEIATTQHQEKLQYFVENKGQIKYTDGTPSPQVQFILDRGNTEIFLLNEGVAWQFKRLIYPEGYEELVAKEHLPSKERELLIRLEEQVRVETYRMDMYFIGANSQPEISTKGKSNDFINFYNHNVLDVHHYGEITYHNIYPGIDWVIYVTETGVKYDFVLEPFADPNLIQMKFSHHEELYLDEKGRLVQGNRMGKFIEEKPISFQGIKKVKTDFVLNNNVLSYRLDDYDKSKPLTIDPVRIWGTYYGSTGPEYGESCAIDNNNNVYLAGYTRDSNNELGYLGYQNLPAADADAFLAKFDENGTRLWSTYYGGQNLDWGFACATDNNGNIYMSGSTSSTTGMSSSGHQNTFGGGTHDVFLVKFNSNGARLWATYYGGNDWEGYAKCVVDSNDNVYMCGATKSSNAIASNGHQNSYGGGSYDLFLVKFDSSGVRLWGTYYGGSSAEENAKCALDGNGNIYLSGNTLSTNGIALNGHQNTYAGGNNDAFLVKFDSNGTRQWGTYYGGDNYEVNDGVAADANGNSYLAGSTQSTSAIAYGGFKDTITGALDAYLVKFAPDGTRLWGTYYGGNSSDYPFGCNTDIAGNVYLHGRAYSNSGIAFNGPQNTFYGGSTDAFLVKFTESGNRIWGTYYGGDQADRSHDCAIGNNGKIYLAGVTYTYTNPSTIAYNGFQNTHDGSTYSDAFLVQFCDGYIPSTGYISGDTLICSNSTATYSIPQVLGATSYTWSLPNGWTGTSTTNTINATTSSTGGEITVTVQIACDTQHVSVLPVTVNPYPCSGEVVVDAPQSVGVFDTIYVELYINNGVDLFSANAKLNYDDTWLDYAGYSVGPYFGVSIISPTPTDLGGQIDFSVSKINGQPGSNGNGLWYTLAFVAGQTFPQNDLELIFEISDLVAYNSQAQQVSLSDSPDTTTMAYPVLVWPGDLNNDNIVNAADILPVGWFYAETGPTRPNASLQWIGQPSPMWGYDNNPPTGSGYKVFADATGDGIIDSLDINAIGQNTDSTHLFLLPDNPYVHGDIVSDFHVRSASNSPYISLEAVDTIYVDDLPATVSVDIKIGSQTVVRDSLFGIAFELQFPPNTQNINTDYSGSILGTLSNDFLKIDDYSNISNDLIGLGATRFNNQEVTASGDILVKVNFEIPATYQNDQFPILSNILACSNKVGINILLEPDTHTIAIVDTSLITGTQNHIFSSGIDFYPNPTHGFLNIISNNNFNNSLLKVTDIQGRTVFEKNLISGNNYVLDMNDYAPSIYLVEIHTKEKIARQKIIKY